MIHKRKALLSAFAAILFFACVRHSTCPTCPTCPECPMCDAEPEEAVAVRWFVTRVIDGDTIVVKAENGERQERVRLLRINTPERNQPGFDEAREALKELVRGGYVDLEFEEPGVEKRDGFGRLAAYVIADEMNCNIEMVRRGWSPFWKKYGKGRLSTQFEAAQSEAVENKRGLWRIAPPVEKKK